MSYSEIIGPVEYNRIISNEHIYIAEADQLIVDLVGQYSNDGFREIVELGCGPNRITSRIASVPNTRVTGIDVDTTFLSFARETGNDKATFLSADATGYRHSTPVGIFVSQGFHHHLPKGPTTHSYLKNVASQLLDGGVYILSDEFLPNYNSPEDRYRKIIVWYSHVINHALTNGFHSLAREEAKTLLDELCESGVREAEKTESEIADILQSVKAIAVAAESDDFRAAHKRADELFLLVAGDSENKVIVSDSSLSLSRGDYKICDQVLRQEIEPAGLEVRDIHHIGPIESIGAMSVYVLQKKA